MSLLSLSKKIVQRGEAEKAAKKAKPKSATKATKKPTKKEAATAGSPILAGSIQLTGVMTEKSMRMQGEQTLVVKVVPTAGKAEIATAVEQLFGVKVTSVRTARNHPKVRRRGMSVGRTTNVKKAYVTVDDISKLNVAP